MYSTRGALVAELVEVVRKLGEFYLHLLELPFVYQSPFYGGKIFAGCRKFLFVQVAYKFLHAAKMHFMQL